MASFFVRMPTFHKNVMPLFVVEPEKQRIFAVNNRMFVR